MHFFRDLFAIWFKPPSLYIPPSPSPISVWLAGLLPVLCLLPFLDKALNIDDPIFVWSAQQILKDPLDFYGFWVNWHGSMDRADLVNQNPPGVAYYLAVVGTLFGWSERALHAAMLLPAAMVGWGCYRLAQHLCPYPLTAALTSVLTPVFLVSAGTLMSDVLMLAFYVWAVALWIEGLEGNRRCWLALAGLLVALAGLTKYIGLSLFVLLGLYGWLHQRRLGAWLFYLLAAFVPVMAFELYTCHLYGHGLIGGAINYSNKDKIINYSQIFVGVLFLGGCFLSPIFYAPRLWSPRILRAAGLILVASMLLSLASVGYKQGGVWFIIHLAVFLAAGWQILALAALDLHQRRDAAAWLLFCWVLGIFVFAVFLNWTVNSRSLLPMLPAVGILVARRLELHVATAKSCADWRWITPPVLGGAVAVAVLAQDAAWANSIRATSRRLMDEYGNTPSGSTVWFQGSWGFQYYMQQQGARRMQNDKLEVNAGDFIVVSTHGISDIPYGPGIRQIANWRIPVSHWGTTMSLQRNAGFYSSRHGIFPYFFGWAEEVYLIYWVSRYP